MIVAEFHLDHPALREPLEQVPDARIAWERSDIVDPQTLRVLVWIPEEHCTALEDALDADPTVVRTKRVLELDNRHLYSVDQQGEEIKAEVYRQFVDEGCVIRKASVAHDGWQIQATYANRESLSRFIQFCEDRDVGVEIQRLLTEDGGPVDIGEFGLTPQQQEILEAAAELGYFSIPRDVSLAELGEALDISGNAASERLRRAMDTLVDQTLVDPGGTGRRT